MEEGEGGWAAAALIRSQMGKRTKSQPLLSYPYLSRWVAVFGTIEIGYCGETNSFIRIVDEGGIVWKGRKKYRTLDAALADAEAGIARWLKDELGTS